VTPSPLDGGYDDLVETDIREFLRTLAVAGQLDQVAGEPA
jgi:hypothetical protein